MKREEWKRLRDRHRLVNQHALHIERRDAWRRAHRRIAWLGTITVALILVAAIMIGG